MKTKIANGFNVVRKMRYTELQKNGDIHLFIIITMRIMVGISALAVGSLFVPFDKFLWLTSKQFTLQDLWLLELFFILCFLVFLQPRNGTSQLRFRLFHVTFAAITILILCYMGHRLLLMGYDLSRDEQMANFDASIFAHGRLVWPLPESWQGEADALNMEFMFPVSQPVAWVSGYLPMNAALRAAVGLLADPALTGPLLTAGSLLLIFSIAKRIWPDDQEAPAIVTLLMLGSGQLIITGMTAYAMPAHLFFNLLWMRLFIADRRVCDGAALAIGFIAMGLHQPLFHPMFVGPFLLSMLIERRWWRLLFFIIGYGVFSLFWLSWPLYVHSLMIGPNSTTAAVGTDFLSRLLQAFSSNMGNLSLTAANLLRFCTWQHLLLLPLLFVGLKATKEDRFAGALALGLLLPIAVMAVILPWQGIGFGYRYLHGVLGNAALLAGYGWRNMKSWHEQLRPVFLRATAASLLVLLPVQSWMAHARYAPFANASLKIDKSDADYVIIEARDGPVMMDTVLNHPDISNRPIRIAYENIRDMDRLTRRICRPGIVVAFGTDAFYKPLWDYFKYKPDRLASENLTKLRVPFEQAGCETQLISR
ncbi:hypothetical protein [Sphingobium aromaticivastans]|uniref:hypothetical protein n=1 Tax=Sphingobium aromaticivastans TaxID=1778665 RepID=UPI00301AF86A